MCARRRSRRFADGPEEIVECVWGLCARQNADHFAVSTARSAEYVDGKNAAQELRPQQARATTMGRIRVGGCVFRYGGVVVAGDIAKVNGCENTGELAQRSVWRAQAVVPDGVKARRRNERCQPSQEFDGR